MRIQTQKKENSNLVIIVSFLLIVIILSGCNKEKINNSNPTPSLPGRINIENLYQKGKDAQKSFDLEEAEAIYKKILETDPHHYRARKRLGEVYYFIGEYEPAIREFKKVLEENPPNPGAAKSNLVLCYLAVDRPENALEYISPEIDEYSRWGTHYSFLAQAEYARFILAGSDKEKKVILEKIKSVLKEGIKKTDNQYARAMLRASLALFNGNYNETGKYLKDALGQEESGRDRISMLFLIGAIRAREGNKKKAESYFKRVLENIKKNRRLNYRSFMDGFYSLWAMEEYGQYILKYKDINEIVEQIPGRIREPETKDFLKHVEEYLSARENKNYGDALQSLEAMENSIKDESIEGDYFYDGIYKPFIMNLLYRAMGNMARKAGKNKDAAEYHKKANTVSREKFPF